MTFHTLTVHREEAHPPFVWQIETWCPRDGGPETVRSGRAHFERVAYLDGLHAAHKLGLAILGGDMTLGYELGVRSSYERVGGNEASRGLSL